jgi:hypothetical protein
MAIGKSKRISKGKKGGKKKVIDSMSRKDWFDFKAPAPFDSRSFGKTCITKTTGTRIATELIKGRVCEVSLADLKNNSDNLVFVLISRPGEKLNYKLKMLKEDSVELHSTEWILLETNYVTSLENGKL